MREIIYEGERHYTAFVGSGALSKLGPEASRLVRGRKAAVVTDSGVPEGHVARVLAGLEQAGFEARSFVLPQGEANKRLEGVQSIYAFFYSLGLTREDAVFAVGGGVPGDMAGFAAATYLRGVSFINVPTTLIAQTDSAYGGKTGVDYLQGKNYVGSFYDPAAVICDTDLLKTLGREEILCGLGEVIKYGAIADGSLLQLVSASGAAVPSDEAVVRCVEIKRSFVTGDERDAGRRRALNFGHTVGHAIEAASGFTVPHGRAVAYGMLAAARMGERLGVTKAGVYDKLFETVKACGLDTDWQDKAVEALPLISIDKKSDGRFVDMILLEDIGHPIRRKLSPSEAFGMLE